MSLGYKHKKYQRPKSNDWGPSKTQQSFRDEVDINKIVARFTKDDLLEVMRNNPGTFADLTKVGNYKEALEKIMLAKETFAKLTPKIRKRFENDPGQLVDFMSDENNLDEAIELGIMPPKKFVAKKDPATPGKTKKDSAGPPAKSTEAKADGE